MLALVRAWRGVLFEESTDEDKNAESIDLVKSALFSMRGSFVSFLRLLLVLVWLLIVELADLHRKSIWDLKIGLLYDKFKLKLN